MYSGFYSLFVLIECCKSWWLSESWLNAWVSACSLCRMFLCVCDRHRLNYAWNGSECKCKWEWNESNGRMEMSETKWIIKKNELIFLAIDSTLTNVDSIELLFMKHILFIRSTSGMSSPENKRIILYVIHYNFIDKYATVWQISEW